MQQLNAALHGRRQGLQPLHLGWGRSQLLQLSEPVQQQGQGAGEGFGFGDQQPCQLQQPLAGSQQFELLTKAAVAADHLGLAQPIEAAASCHLGFDQR